MCSRMNNITNNGEESRIEIEKQCRIHTHNAFDKEKCKQKQVLIETKQEKITRKDRRTSLGSIET